MPWSQDYAPRGSSFSLGTVLLEGRGWWIWQEAGAALGLGLHCASHMASAPGGLITALLQPGWPEAKSSRVSPSSWM